MGSVLQLFFSMDGENVGQASVFLNFYENEHTLQLLLQFYLQRIFLLQPIAPKPLMPFDPTPLESAKISTRRIGSVSFKKLPMSISK